MRGEGEEYESETYSENDTKLSDVLEGDNIHAKLSLLWQWACLHPFVVFITGVALFWFCQFPWIAWMMRRLCRTGYVRIKNMSPLDLELELEGEPFR